jgi:hypothetical protein
MCLCWLWLLCLCRFNWHWSSARTNLTSTQFYSAKHFRPSLAHHLQVNWRSTEQQDQTTPKASVRMKHSLAYHLKLLVWQPKSFIRLVIGGSMRLKHQLAHLSIFEARDQNNKTFLPTFLIQRCVCSLPFLT